METDVGRSAVTTQFGNKFEQWNKKGVEEKECRLECDRTRHFISTRTASFGTLKYYGNTSNSHEISLLD